MELAISAIRPNPDQPRRVFPNEELDELAGSIREHGILQPLIVQAASTGGFELVSGERRLRAAERAGLKTVPTIVVDSRSADGSLVMALVENVQRADLNALELAKAYKRLQDEFGRTQEEIAATVGKSRPHIANTLRLLELSEQIQDAVAEGKISAGHAKALLMAPKHARLIIYEQIIKKNLNVRQVEKAARALGKGDTGKHKDKLTPESCPDTTDKAVIREMELALESLFGRKISIARNHDGKGKIVVDFYDDRDLERLVEKLLRKN
jgi:ParB family transcriptional regulator, chromosome partitioning protein